MVRFWLLDFALKWMRVDYDLIEHDDYNNDYHNHLIEYVQHVYDFNDYPEPLQLQYIDDKLNNHDGQP